jgi:hypothetical protein
MALDLSVGEMLERIGHDGSNIMWPDLPEPRCRRGFHTQECIRVALLLGKSVTPVEYEARLAPGDVEPLVVYQREYFHKLLNTSLGVVTGVVGHNGSAKGHAMAYCQSFVADPTTGIVTCGLPDGFRPTCLWVVNDER